MAIKSKHAISRTSKRKTKISKKRTSKHKTKTNKKRTSKRSKRNLSKKFCRSKLSEKIRINMREYKSGNKKIKSPLQAIAIAYSQIKKKYPKCSRSLKRKTKK